MSKTHWRIAFWLMTALTVGMEVWAANDHNPITETWTEALTRYIPAPLLLAVVAWFATWLVQHFRDSTRKKAEREQAAADSRPPTMLRRVDFDTSDER